MKTFNLLFVLSMFVFASCETADLADDQNTADLKFINESDVVLIDDNPPSSNTHMSAFVNGSAFRVYNLTGTAINDTVIIKADSGVSNRSTAITLNLPSDITVGNYQIGNDVSGGDFTASVSVNGRLQEVVLGYLYITDHTADTGKISGRFRLDTDEFQVTHGLFKSTY